MFNRLSIISGVLEVNEYIEKFSEIKPHLDEISKMPIDEVFLINDGCKESVTNLIVEYLEYFDIDVIYSEKEQV